MDRVAKVCAIALALTYAMSASGAPSIAFSKESSVLIFGGQHHPDRAGRDFGALYSMAPGAGPVLLRKIEGGILGVEAAPRGPLIAALEELRRTDDEIRNPQLVILDSHGAVQRIVPSVYAFSWSPNGRRVAYVTGRPDSRNFDPTGTWILDLDSGLTRKIYPSGADVHWAVWDGNIYIDTSEEVRDRQVEVMRFEPARERAVETSHHGIYFSPDGLYYYRGSSHGDLGGEVFETSTDNQIHLTELSKVEGSPVGIGWIGSHMLISRATGIVDVNYIEDLDSGSRAQAAGRIIPIAAERDRAILFQKGAAPERALSTLAVK